MKLLKILGAYSLLLMSLLGCDPSAPADEYFLFVGTYTGEGSEGIYLYKFDAETGELDSLSAAKGVDNPSYLALSPDNSHLYAVNEMADSAEATVSSFAFNKDNKTISFINKQSSAGGAPCYISVDETGEYAFVGNYLGGSVALLPINDTGALEPATQVIKHEGSSVNKNRQNSPHVHCTYLTPDNDALIVNDLGTDQVMQYSFDADSGSLTKTAENKYKARPGAGPRHITFHPNAKFAYLIEELKGSVISFTYDEQLSPIQTISALPKGFEGAVSGADLHVSPDGQFLYVSMREDLNQIVIFKIDQQSGQLTYVDRQSTNGLHPRNFVIDPTGEYVLVANKNSDNVVVFKRNKSTGTLTPTGTELHISMPVCLKMASAN